MSSRWRPNWPACTPRRWRFYDGRGRVAPARPIGGSRRYSEEDIAVLRRIQDLTTAGLNLEGVKQVMALEAEVARLRAEVARVQLEAREAVDRTHRQYRRDLVPVRHSPERWAPP